MADDVVKQQIIQQYGWPSTPIVHQSVMLSIKNMAFPTQNKKTLVRMKNN